MPIDRGRTIISRNPEITAYEIAVANGFVGTQQDWLNSYIGFPTYVGYVTDAGEGPIVVTALNSSAANYLGEIEWELNDPTSMTGTTLTDKFTEFTFLELNYCRTDTVSNLKISNAQVNNSKSITVSYDGLGTIHGMFKIIVYPGEYLAEE